MKVLISSVIFPNPVEINKGIYIKKQVLALSRIEDIEVKVIAPVPYLLKFKRYSTYRGIHSREIVDGLEVYHPRYFVPPKLFRSLHGIFFFMSLLRFYLNFSKKFYPDILLGFWAYPDGFANVLFAKILNIPVVIGCLGSDINRYKDYFIRRKIITWSLNRANKVLVVSDALKKEVLKLGVEDEKVKVIHNGIDPEVFFPKDRDEIRKLFKLNHDEKIVICVARLSSEKGINRLIQAFTKIRGDKIRLFVIGDGPEKKSLIKLTQHLGLNGKIRFVGERPHEEISDWINTADLVCLPSLSEGWPNILMESLACGKPVVASKVGGVPEIITSDKLGVMVPPGDIERLAKGIESALKKSRDHQFIRDSVASRTWDVVAKEIYQEILELVDN